MRKEYDFTKGRRGRARDLPPVEGLDRYTKERITIMLDRDVLEYFRTKARKPGADPYQTQINRALRSYVFGEEQQERLVDDDRFISRVAERVAMYQRGEGQTPKASKVPEKK